MSEVLKAIPPKYRDVLIEHLNEALNQRYTTGICFTVYLAIKRIRERYVSPFALRSLKTQLPSILSDHEFVEEEECPYWIKGDDLIALQLEDEERSNERAYDKFMFEVTPDGSALAYEEDEISEDLLKDIETFSDRRKSVIRHLIQLLEEIPYEEAA